MTKRKKVTKAQRRVRALKQHDPTPVAVQPAEAEWAQYEPDEVKSAPHSFIIFRGKVGRHIKQLMKDLRLVMEPFTASNLKMRKGNVLKDYISISSYFNVTHLSILSRTTISPYFKICRIPRGPSLTFRILGYTLSRDVLSSLRKQVTYEMQFSHHPLLIMNNFTTGEKHLEILSSTFQNMFPSININKVQLRAIRRVLMLNYNEEDDTIDLRHYTITHQPVGVSKGIKKILVAKNNKIPNLGNCTDISEFLTKTGYASDSDAEDVSEKVTISQKFTGKGARSTNEIAVKLVELGPRMKLQLIKVEEGILEGEVLYHKLQDKTDEEKLRIRKERIAKRKLKEKRKSEQEANIKKKQLEKELHRKKSMEGMGIVEKDSLEDDAEWYKKEVGADPDENAFGVSSSSETKLNRKRRGDKSMHSDVDAKVRRVSKFTKVKQKAKILKKERQKNSLEKAKRLERKERKSQVGGAGRNRRNFRGKGAGGYSKPSKSKLANKKPSMKIKTTKKSSKNSN